MLLNSAFAILTVVMFAFFLNTTVKLKASLTPLVSIAVLIDIPIIFGMVNQLRTGVCVAYALAVFSFAFSVYQNRNNLKNRIKDFLTAGVILFIISSVAMMIFMFTRQPLMSEWDEFSFWGISQKLVKIHDALYTYYDSSMIGNSTPPTLAVLSYYFQTFTAEFAEWRSFLAYDVVFFAAYSAFTAMFEKKDWNASFMMFLYGFVLPYIFEVYTRIIYLEPVYMLTYADLPLGILFSGVFAVYFAQDDCDSRDILPLLPLIMFLTLIKDMGFALSCIVLFCAFFDMLVSKKNFTYLKIKGFFGKGFAAFTMLMTAAMSFASWSYHMAKVMNRNSFELGGETNMGYVQMLTTGVRELLGIGEVSYKFATIKGYMISAFFNTKLSMLGTGVMVVGIITVIFVIAFIFGDKTARTRTVILYVTSWIGFIGYYVFHLFLYVYIFKDNGYGLVSYNRYIYPYYMGWMTMALLTLCLSVKVSDGWKKLLSSAALTGYVLLAFACFTYLTSPDLLFMGVEDSSYQTRISVLKKAEAIRPYLGEDDVLFVYSGNDNTQKWFMYTYELADHIIVEHIGVNTEGLTEEEAAEKDRQNLYREFVDNGVNAIIIDYGSEELERLYGDLFDKDASGVGMNEVACYKVIYTDDWFRFELIGKETVS